MSSRFVMGMVTMCRVGTLLAAAALLGGCAAASAQTKVLIYSDQSAGSLMMSSANRHSEIMSGSDVTFTTDAEQMPALIDGDNWGQILIFARWTAEEPAYVQNLRQFACRKPRAMVLMQLWHDDGRTISPRVCVSASVAWVMWTNNFTLVTYSDATDKGPGERDGKRSFEDQVWPTWEYIIPRRPVGIILLPPEAVEQRETFDLHDWMVSLTECKSGCVRTSSKDEQGCAEYRSQDLANCAALHAGDPEKLAACTAKYEEHYQNCLRLAIDRYRDCIALCSSTPQAEQTVGGGVTK
ncbi:MAG: hypothetical protein IPM13_09350 [Phycisphaerales bacterium]|nr:hypothetical protein [Phycisphaerales bacterium]